MAIIYPYIKDLFKAYQGEKRITRLSLALWLTDEYTGEKPIGPIKVSLKEHKKRGFVNLTGYYCFTDVPNGNYTLTIEGEYYFPVTKQIDLPLSDNKKPVITVTLKPRPHYPFPTATTLVRGVFRNPEAVANAVIKVRNRPIETKTNEQGEFVLYFKGIKTEDIILEITDIEPVSAMVREGKTESLGVLPRR